MLAALLARQPTERVALVVAHPDDETIAAGGSLHLMPGLLLVHVTDGAPRGLDDAAAAGFPTPEAYGAGRQAELEAALALCGEPPHRVALGIVDQDASLDIPGIARRLAGLFRRHRVRAVLTHAYEGGHPDHDATALAVHLAVHGAAQGRAVFEFAGYHAGPEGALVTGRFLKHAPAGGGEVAIARPPADAARKRAMLACFRTQAAMLRHFGAEQERFRAAPHYDFSKPPHPGRLNYEHWGWSMTGERWRGLAAAAWDARCAA